MSQPARLHLYPSQRQEVAAALRTIEAGISNAKEVTIVVRNLESYRDHISALVPRIGARELGEQPLVRQAGWRLIRLMLRLALLKLQGRPLRDFLLTINSDLFIYDRTLDEAARAFDQWAHQAAWNSTIDSFETTLRKVGHAPLLRIVEWVKRVEVGEAESFTFDQSHFNQITSILEGPDFRLQMGHETGVIEFLASLQQPHYSYAQLVEAAHNAHQPSDSESIEMQVDNVFVHFEAFDMQSAAAPPLCCFGLSEEMLHSKAAGTLLRGWTKKGATKLLGTADRELGQRPNSTIPATAWCRVEYKEHEIVPAKPYFEVESRGAQFSEDEREQDTNGDLPIFSPSSIAEFSSCPYRYFAGYRLKLRDESRVPDDSYWGLSPFIVGQIAHRAFETLLRRTELVDDPLLGAIDHIANHIEGHRFEGAFQRRAWSKARFEIAAAIATMREGLAGDRTVIAEEHPFSIMLDVPMGGDDHRTVELRGRIDRVDVVQDDAEEGADNGDRLYLIVDYKSASSPLGPAIRQDMLELIRPQLPIYMLAVGQTLAQGRYENVTGAVEYRYRSTSPEGGLVDQRLKGRPQFSSRRYEGFDSRAQFQRIEQQLATAIQRILNNDRALEPQIQEYCGFGQCPYWSMCRIGEVKS